MNTLIAVTGERGSFRVPVTDETWVVQVDHPDFERWYDSVEVERSFVEIQLRRGVTLEGRVVDEDGQPVPEVRVSMFCKDRRQPAATDEDGRWAFMMESRFARPRKRSKSTRFPSAPS